MKKYQIAVIGGGAAGVMAALRSVLNNDQCLLFPGTPTDRRKSRAFWVSKVENMPGYHHFTKGIVQPNKDTLTWISESEFASNLHLVKNKGVVSVLKNDDGLFELTDSAGEKYLSEYVIMATGMMDVQPIINGTIKDVLPYANKQTIDYCVICDGHHTFNKTTGIIGHGAGAAWIAVMLVERYGIKDMSILTNGHEPEFSDDLKELIKLYEIKVYREAIKEIIGEPRNGNLEGFELVDGTKLDIVMSFVSMGSIVYNDLAVSLGAEVDRRGYVLTNEKGETNIEGLYIAGDLRANSMKQIYTSWNHAVLSANDINMKIRVKARAERKRIS